MCITISWQPQDIIEFRVSTCLPGAAVLLSKQGCFTCLPNILFIHENFSVIPEETMLKIKRGCIPDLKYQYCLHPLFMILGDF
jgi:hypothetical protein